MKINAVAATLLLLAPLAQAQSWTQLLASPGADVSLPAVPAPVLAPDGTGLIFVQTFNQNGPASPFTTLHALGNDGLLQPGLDVSRGPFNGQTVFSPLGASAFNGHRAIFFHNGTPGLVQSSIMLYRPGETVHHGHFSFQHGAVLSRFAADGAGSVYLTRLLTQQLPDRPELFYFGNQQWHFNRYYGGCAAGDHWPVALLDVDIDLDRPRITAVTRCLHASSPGTLALTEYDPQTGDILSVRRSWPYADSAAPVVAAHAIGDGRYVIEQADAATGARTARVISADGEGGPLPLPPQFQLRKPVRHADSVLLPAVDSTRGQFGALRIAGKSVEWIEFMDMPAIANLDLTWAGDRDGDVVVGYRRPQPGDDGPVQLIQLDNQGRVVSRRSISHTTRPGARVVLQAEPLSNEIVLAADVVLPDGRDAVYLEQFVLDPGIDTIPWLPIRP
jgi:hypothetical protein